MNFIQIWWSATWTAMLTVKAEALGTSNHCRICKQNVDFDFPHKNLFDNYFEIESSESLSLIEVARDLLDLPVSF